MNQAGNATLSLTSKQFDELRAIAQTGLSYASDPYDKERFTQLLELTARIAQGCAKPMAEQWLATFYEEIAYITPKLCVRAVLLEKNKILLVKERQAQRWSLPGGWADVGLSASENVIKELQEETGLTCRVNRMLAFWDKHKHAHPPHSPHTYQSYFLCERLSGEFTLSHEISAIDFFSPDALPSLCAHRVTEKQIHRLIELSLSTQAVAFD